MQMTDEEKKAIERFKEYIAYCDNNKECKEELKQCFGCTIEYEEIKAMKTILNLIQKQEKVIDEMSGYLAVIRDCPNEDFGANLDCEKRCNNTDELYEECWKRWFYRKVEEDEI
jgi:hypothetical protein